MRAVASTWDAIDYAPVGDGFVAPESHWPFIAAVPMSREQRIALNRLALRFSCEMVAHFERYIVDYLEQHSDRLHGALSDRAARVFADDERAHIGGFLRLLRAIAPAEYRGDQLAFFTWSCWDAAVVRFAPAVTFFVAAELLEEMFVHLHHDMEQHAADTLPLAREVMALHAREEKSHLSMDARVLSARQRALPAWRFALEAIASLAIVAIVDRRTSTVWRGAIDDRAAALGLDSTQRERLSRKRLSRSDKTGLRAWMERRREQPFPGSRVLRAVLARSL